MAQGLPDLVSHVKLDTTGVTTGVAKAKTELGGLKTSTSGLQSEFKGLLSSITGVGGGTSALSGVFSKLSGSVGTARTAMGGVSAEGGKLASVMTGVGAGVAGVGLALGALAVEGLGKFTAAAGQVRGLAATLGSSAEDASKLRNVAIGLGVDVDTMGKAFFKLGPILEKSKGDIAGVHVELAQTKTGGLDYIGTLDNLRGAYQQLTDPAQKAAFALELFKKTGQELRPILSATNEQFKEMAAHGPIFNDKDLKAAKDLGIAQRELKQSVDSAEIALAKGLVPVLTQVSTAATNGVEGLHRFGDALAHIKDNGGPASVAVSGLEKAFAAVVKNVTPLGNIMDLLGGSNKKTAGSAADHAEAEKKLADAMKDAEDKAAALRKEIDQLATAQERNLDATLALEHGQVALQKAVDDSKQAHIDAEKAVQQYGRASEETDAAVNKAIESDIALKDAAISVAKETRDKAVAESEAAGITVSAQGKVDLLKQALLQQADTIGGPVAEQIRNYVSHIESIPDEKPTYIHLPGADGVLGTLDDIYNRIDAIPSQKDVYVVVHDESTGREEGTDRTGNQVATGGELGRNGVIPMARGGRTSGFVTNRPTFLVGEGNPAYPEYVIATDPKYRDRNKKLAMRALRGLKMMAGGGAMSEGGTWKHEVNAQGQPEDIWYPAGWTPATGAANMAAAGAAPRASAPRSSGGGRTSGSYGSQTFDIHIDYGKIGEAVAAAIANGDITVEVDGTTFGRVAAKSLSGIRRP